MSIRWGSATKKTDESEVFKRVPYLCIVTRWLLPFLTRPLLHPAQLTCLTLPRAIHVVAHKNQRDEHRRAVADCEIEAIMGFTD